MIDFIIIIYNLMISLCFVTIMMGVSPLAQGL